MTKGLKDLVLLLWIFVYLSRFFSSCDTKEAVCFSYKIASEYLINGRCLSSYGLPYMRMITSSSSVYRCCCPICPMLDKGSKSAIMNDPDPSFRITEFTQRYRVASLLFILWGGSQMSQNLGLPGYMDSLQAKILEFIDTGGIFVYGITHVCQFHKPACTLIRVVLPGHAWKRALSDDVIREHWTHVSNTFYSRLILWTVSASLSEIRFKKRT